MKRMLKSGVLILSLLLLCSGVVSCGNNKENGQSASKVYVFEAEYAKLPTIGAGWSGGMGGVSPDLDGLFNASNDYFVVGMNAKGSTLTFEIESDSDVNDAKIVARLSAEDPAGLLNGGGEDPKSFSITSETFQFIVNDNALTYETIAFNGIKTTNKFVDYTISTNVPLKAGKNIIQFKTNNEVSLGGTTQATAPIVDCVKVTTTANLTWNELVSNLPE